MSHATSEIIKFHCGTLNNLVSKLDANASGKFVDDRSSNSKKQHVHLLYEKYVILAMRISSRDQKIF
jgi:hypothetical protein